MKKSNAEQMIDQITTMAKQFGAGDALSWMVGGRDCMIVNRTEIDSAVNRLSSFVGWAEQEGKLAALDGLNKVLGYAQGIQHARLSLLAAGIEATA